MTARRHLLALVAAATTAGLAAQTVALDPLVVTATRAPQAASTLPVRIEVFGPADLQDSLVVDEALRRSAAFSLFRRTSSLTANPTAQGVSLRGLGPSGASRSLVLLDGVPLNDPFGGWVAWTKVPGLALDRAEIVRGGGSGVWGNAALGGSVQLLTTPLAGEATAAEAIFGDFDTRSGELALTRTSESGSSTVRVDAAAFATDGPGLVRHPGPIDRRADLTYERAQADWRLALGPTTSLTLTARAYAEARGNGTPLQRNTSHEAFFSAAIAGAPAAGPAWSGALYFQNQSFQSFFSSVNAGRTAETPANNQYRVPATAAGGAFSVTQTSPSGATTTIGADFRRVEGQTRELYSWNGTAFTQRRAAGGDQTFAGVFVRHEQPWEAGWRGSLGLRLDHWENTGGFRHEAAIATGNITREDHYAGHTGDELSPDLGLVWQATPAIRARASVYQAFRVPTLNEYYRPFRVGNVTTDANPALVPETLTGGEAGVDLGTARAGATVTAFTDDIRHAVTNVTLAPNQRQRRNLDRVRGRGLELGAHWQPRPALRLEADFLLGDTRVITAGAGAAALDGKRLAEVPRQTLTAGATWSPRPGLTVHARLRRVSAQFEDDENTLPLAPATTVDFAVSCRVGRYGELFATVDNLFAASVETGHTVDGVVSTGVPRLVFGGWRRRF